MSVIDVNTKAYTREVLKFIKIMYVKVSSTNVTNVNTYLKAITTCSNTSFQNMNICALVSRKSQYTCTFVMKISQHMCTCVSEIIKYLYFCRKNHTILALWLRKMTSKNPHGGRGRGGDGQHF